MPRVTKAEVRRWLKRAREDIRDIEDVLKQPGPLTKDDKSDIYDWALDLSGAGGELAALTEE